ncbi:hypothetical protein V8E52_004960 [Russula decolorans]
MWLKCLILILKMAWAKLISFLNGLISKISQNKPVKFFSSFPDVEGKVIHCYPLLSLYFHNVGGRCLAWPSLDLTDGTRVDMTSTPCCPRT